MATKRAVLELLKREELLVVVDAFDLSVPNRKNRDGLVEAIAASKRATLAAFLPELNKDRLKELCEALGLDTSGRSKADFLERLGVKAPDDKPFSSRSGAESAAPAVSTSPSSPPPASKRKAAAKNGGDLGFETTLWQAADKLRNNLDAAEYKHVVLGLIFLKYISDAFSERYKQLELEVEEGADPEDPDEYRANNVFWVPQEARWEKIQANAKKPTNGKTIDDAMTPSSEKTPPSKACSRRTTPAPSSTSSAWANSST